MWDRTTRKEIAAFPARTNFPTYEHVSERRALALSPDETTLVLGAGNEIAIWDVSSKRHKTDLRGHTNLVGYLEFSPDGRTLVSGSHDGTARIWDFSVDPPELLSVLSVGYAVWCMAFSADGALLALSGSGFDVKLWDLSTIRVPRELLPLKGHITAIFGLAFSPVGRVLATGGADIILWQLGPRGEAISERRLVRGRGGVGVIDFVTFARDGQTLISAGTDRNITLWGLSDADREPARLMGHMGEIHSLAVSPDGRLLASASYDGSVKLWDDSAPRQAAKTMSHSTFVTSAAFSPDSKLLASVAYKSGTVKLWDVATKELVTEREVIPDGAFSSVVFSPDGRVLAGGASGGIRLLQVPSLLEITNFPGANPTFSSDGTELTYSRRGVIHRRNLKSGDVQEVWSTGWGRLSAMTVFSDGRSIAAAGGESFAQVRLWSADAPDRFIELGTHGERVNRLTSSPNSQWLASASWDGTTRIWNLARLSEPSVTLAGHKGSVWDVAFSRDSRTVATGGDDYTVKLWHLASRQEAATLRGHTHVVSALTFSPDGRNLASCGGGDGTVRIWHAPTLEEIAAAEKTKEARR